MLDQNDKLDVLQADGNALRMHFDGLSTFSDINMVASLSRWNHIHYSFDVRCETSAVFAEVIEAWR